MQTILPAGGALQRRAGGCGSSVKLDDVAVEDRRRTPGGRPGGRGPVPEVPPREPPPAPPSAVGKTPSLHPSTSGKAPAPPRRHRG
jgi:hypothetical protein